MPSLEIFRQDLQLVTLIHIASFTLSTFPLLKLQYCTCTVIFSLSPKYFITFLLQHCSTSAHTGSVILGERIDSDPVEEEDDQAGGCHMTTRKSRRAIQFDAEEGTVKQTFVTLKYSSKFSLI